MPTSAAPWGRRSHRSPRCVMSSSGSLRRGWCLTCWPLPTRGRSICWCGIRWRSAGAWPPETLGLAHAACGPLFCFWDGAWHAVPDEVAKPELDGLRAVHGLPRDPELTMLHRHLYLACLPRSFLGDLSTPPTVRFLRPVPFDRLEGEALPAWVEELPPRPTVHASLGTIFHRTPGVFEAILAGLRDEPINVLLAVGLDQDPERFGPQPPHNRIERYFPHELLLPRCDVVIAHGGYGSVMACLAAGVPIVVIPLAGGDQAGNAERCAALGVTRVVAADQRAPEVIRKAVREILQDSGYREQASRLRDQIRAAARTRPCSQPPGAAPRRSWVVRDAGQVMTCL
jgi:hypothetical protein